MYPCLKISLKKIYENTKMIVDKCQEININVWGVTKVFCGHPEIARTLQAAGVVALADSRIQNIIRLKEANLNNLVLLRIPMLSEIDAIIKYVDICAVSEITTVQALDKAAQFYNTRQQVMIMIDVGDLREGVYYDRVAQFISAWPDTNNIDIVGIGANLTCYSGVLPTIKITERLVQAAKLFKQALGLNLEIISGGNTSSLGLVWRKQMPPGINNLRLGEGLILGGLTLPEGPIAGTHQDSFILQAEIVELKCKPSVPSDEIGCDAFGNIPVFEDLGWHYRAIAAIGRQDVFPERMTPVDSTLKILGASSDHLLLGLPDNHAYRIGDIVEFTLDYVGVLNAMTSQYVAKVIDK